VTSLLFTSGRRPCPGRPRALRGSFSAVGLAFVAGGVAALGSETSWWDLRTGVRRSRLERRLERRPLALSADGRVAAYEVEGQAVQLVEVDTGKDGKKFGRDVNCVAFSADGRLLATGSDGAKVSLWGVASGKLVRQLTWPDKLLTWVALSPDGSRLACGGEFTKLVRLYEAATGKRLFDLKGGAGGTTPRPSRPTGGPWPPAGATASSVSGRRSPGSSWSRSRDIGGLSSPSPSPPTARSSPPGARIPRP
jgi:WD40 repeat protein